MMNLPSSIKHWGLPIQDFNYKHEIIPLRKEVCEIRFKSYDILPVTQDTLIEDMVRRVDENDVVLDAGAHTGLYTIVLDKCGCDVIPIEASPVVFDQLQSNLRLNDVDASPLNIGVGGENDELAFYLSSARARSSFDPSKAKEKTGSVIGTTEIEVRTIDSLLNEGEIPVPDHIKLDVEGLGPEVLQGSVETLREHHPTIYWEPHGTGIDGSNPGSVEEFLRDMGYEITKLDYPVIAE